MAIEIERRFLVKGKDWKTHIRNSDDLIQGYLTSQKDFWTVRVRVKNKQEAWLTLKSAPEQISCNEFEYSVPLNHAEIILKKTTQKIKKTRFHVDLIGGRWVIDCFQDENFPLVIAEVELDSEDAEITIPTWCFKEITGQYSFSNASLAKNPISKWGHEKLIALGKD